MLRDLSFFSQTNLTYLSNLTGLEIDKFGLTQEYEKMDNQTIRNILKLITGFKILKELRLIESKISNFDFDFSNMAKLEKFELSLNVFSKVTIKSNFIKFLILKKNQITSIDYTWFQNLPNLIELDLSENILLSISQKSFSNLPNLQKIDLSKNFLVSIEAPLFPKVNKLKTLSLGNNNLTDISFLATDDFSMLIYLDLSWNFIFLADFGKFYLPNLQELYLNNNLVQKISSDLFADMKKLRVLEMHQNQIEIVENFQEPSKYLIKLQLSHNKLKNIRFIRNLNNLEYLILSNNAITTLETSLNAKEKLKELYLTNNRLTNISLPRLKSLRYLELKNNLIEYISTKDLRQCENLKTLNLKDNKIFHIEPKSFELNTNLAKLLLANNYLATIPTISTLSNLYELDLKNQNGKLTILPNNAFEIKNLNSQALFVDLTLNNITAYQPRIFCSQFTENSIIQNISLHLDDLNRMDKCSLKQLAQANIILTVENSLNCELRKCPICIQYK